MKVSYAGRDIPKKPASKRKQGSKGPGQPSKKQRGQAATAASVGAVLEKEPEIGETMGTTVAFVAPSVPSAAPKSKCHSTDFRSSYFVI